MNDVVCHTLEEASQRLNLSETVLVRLSQYFKVPASAYDSVDGLSLGGLSFKDDPLFMESDLAFFRELKERLVSGETLESLKRRPPHPLPATVPSKRPSSSSDTPITINAALRHAEQSRNEDTPGNLGASSIPPPEKLQKASIRQIDNPQLFSKVAERNFKHYKHQNGVGIGQVFKKILNGIAEALLEPETTLQVLPKERAPIPPPALSLDGRSPFISRLMIRQDFWSHSSVLSATERLTGNVITPEHSEDASTSNGMDPVLPAQAVFEDEESLLTKRSPSLISPQSAVYGRTLEPRISQAARQLKERALSPGRHS